MGFPCSSPSLWALGFHSCLQVSSLSPFHTSDPPTHPMVHFSPFTDLQR